MNLPAVGQTCTLAGSPFNFVNNPPPAPAGPQATMTWVTSGVSADGLDPGMETSPRNSTRHFRRYGRVCEHWLDHQHLFRDDYGGDSKHLGPGAKHRDAHGFGPHVDVVLFAAPRRIAIDDSSPRRIGRRNCRPICFVMATSRCPLLTDSGHL